MRISGRKIELRPAEESDREKIYSWLTQSDLTCSMFGLDKDSDPAIPTWQEFCADYTPSFFDLSGDGKGRNYIILVGSEEAGTVGYDQLDTEKDRVLLDIWMRSEKYCSHGYGSDALETLCKYINKTYGITQFIISPSARNTRAVAAYKKAGFKAFRIIDKQEQIEEFGIAEYDDNLFMIKKIQ